LLAKKKNLKETSSALNDSRKLEGKNKRTALIERFKKGVLKVKSARQEGVQSRRSGGAETPSIRHEKPIQSSHTSQSIAHENAVQ